MISQKEFNLISDVHHRYESIKFISTFALIDELRNRHGVCTTVVNEGELNTTKLSGPKILLVISVDQP